MAGRILLEGGAELYVSDLISVGGQLLLTDARLRFNPGELIRKIDASVAVDLPLREIEELRFESGHIELRTRVATHRLHGPLVPRLYAALESLRRGVVPERLDELPAWLWHAPLPTRGVIVASGRRWCFVPTGVGRRAPIAFGLEDVVFAYREGRLVPRIVIELAGDELRFALRAADACFEQLARGLLEASSPDDPGTTPTGEIADTERGLELIARWWPEPVRGADLLSMAPVVQVGRSGGVRRGWVVLASDRVMFLPAAGHELGVHMLSLPVSELELPSAEVAFAGELLLIGGGASVRLVPRGGRGGGSTRPTRGRSPRGWAYAVRFWQRLHAGNREPAADALGDVAVLDDRSHLELATDRDAIALAA